MRQGDSARGGLTGGPPGAARGRREAHSTTASAAFEADARRWLRAYPRRWRWQREEEVLGLLADLAEPGATRLDARARRELVREGLATRWRTRPPWGSWLLYRLFDRRIPREYAAWAADDIDGFWWPARTFLWALWWLPLLHIVMEPFSMPGTVFIVLTVAAATMMLGPGYRRRQAQLKHVVVRAGDPWLPGAWVTRETARERASAHSLAPWVISLLGLAALAGTVSTLIGPHGPRARADGPAQVELYVGPVAAEVRPVLLAVIAAGLLLGLVLGGVGVRRLRRRLPERPAQPWRRVRPIGVSGRTAVVLGAAAILAVAWLEVTGALTIGVGATLAAVALLLLPGAVVAARVARRPATGATGSDRTASSPAGPDLAAADVWTMMTSGVLPEVDQPAEAAVPYTGPLPDGVVPRSAERPSPPYPARIPR